MKLRETRTIQALAAACALLWPLANSQAQTTNANTNATADMASPTEACAPASGAQPSHTQIPQALEQQLQTQLPACQNNLAWLAWAGQALLRSGQHGLAADYLERALMLDPRSRELQLDYAMALAGHGQEDSAVLLLQALLAEPDMPQHLRTSVTATVQSLLAPAVPAPVAAHRVVAAVRVGRDSNLLGAPNLSELGLTLGGQYITLPLDPSYMSQPGHYVRSELGWSYTTTRASGVQLQTWAQLRDRHSPAVQAASLQQLSLGGEVRQSLAYANLSIMRLQGQTGLSYKQSTAGAGLWAAMGQTAQQCLANAGAQWQDRQVTSNPLLSGQYRGLVAQWLCEPQESTHSLLASWMLEANKGQDRPTDPARAGGPQHESGMRLQLVTRRNPLQPAAAAVVPTWAAQFTRSHWLLELEWNKKIDQKNYSELLGDVPRQAKRVSGRLEWQASLAQAPQWQVQAGWQWTRQQSNLQLFKLNNQGPYAGVSRNW